MKYIYQVESYYSGWTSEGVFSSVKLAKHHILKRKEYGSQRILKRMLNHPKGLCAEVFQVFIDMKGNITKPESIGK